MAASVSSNVTSGMALSSISEDMHAKHHRKEGRHSEARSPHCSWKSPMDTLTILLDMTSTEKCARPSASCNNVRR